MTWNEIPHKLDGLELTSVAKLPGNWQIEANLAETDPACPECGSPSVTRHSRYVRTLDDLPVLGVRVSIKVRVGRWRCQNTRCSRTICGQRLPGKAAPIQLEEGNFAEPSPACL